jgi:hypothetical protein
MSNELLSPRFLFRFCVPCKYRASLWTKKGIALDESYRLPHLGQLEGEPALADLRAAWSEQGLAFVARVEGKRHAPWCRAAQLEESDGLHVWIDTRDTHNVHRASRFCHRFAFLPAGGGARGEESLAGQLMINRAREQAKPANSEQLHVRAESFPGGYQVEAYLEAAALTGFDPQEHPRLGFMYAILDRERGEQTFTVGNAFPYQEDPSLWGSLELAR